MELKTFCTTDLKDGHRLPVTLCHVFSEVEFKMHESSIANDGCRFYNYPSQSFDHFFSYMLVQHTNHHIILLKMACPPMPYKTLKWKILSVAWQNALKCYILKEQLGCKIPEKECKMHVSSYGEDCCKCRNLNTLV